MQLSGKLTTGKPKQENNVKTGYLVGKSRIKPPVGVTHSTLEQIRVFYVLLRVREALICRERRVCEIK